MDTVLGVTFDGFAILAADKTEAMSIIKLSEDSEKIHKLTAHIAMGIMGDSGDADQFAKFVQCNFELEKFRDDGWEIRCEQACNWIQHQLALSIRSNSPYQVFPLIAGYDLDKNCAKTFWLDYLGTGAEVTYGAHGYGESFAVGYLDKHHKADMSKDAAIELVKGALDCIQTRLIVIQQKFQMVLVDKDGIHRLPDHFINRTKCGPS